VAAARNIALIGAGFIAGAHALALRPRKNLRIAAVVDPARERVVGLAQSLGAAPFASVEELLAAMKPDAAHVLTPPPTHAGIGEVLLRAGVDVLLEKPMAETPEECARLVAAAQQSGAALAVNHNFRFHPVCLRARALIASGRYGRPRRAQMRYAAPLRQMSARQFGHWMFESPRNLLLEQAVHPLSVLDELLSGIESVTATSSPPARPAEGIAVATDWSLALHCGAGLGLLEVSLGASFPSWTLSVLCDDGVVEADFFEGRVAARRPHAAIAPIDNAFRNLGMGVGGFGASMSGLGDFLLEIARLRPASDGFNRSMSGAIGAFHDALDRGERCVGEQGARLVRICNEAATAVAAAAPRRLRSPAAGQPCDVVIAGGTGFIGTHLVARLLREGRTISVLARGARNLAAPFHDARVTVHRGSISDPAALERAFTGARQAVILAHGGGGATRAAVETAMAGGARAARAAATAAGCERVIFASSSAALYLGDPAQTVTMATAPDPEPDRRGDYARAKILAERAMAEAGAPVAILRPAVVVGEGATPFHSALGAFENETHCTGWNDGRNPLPFVLAQDVADAIVRALDADLGDVAGRAFNLAGDVRWSARRYVAELAAATGRPLRFHPTSLAALIASEWLKWGVKKIAGRRDVAEPSIRDFRSRGMAAEIDTSEEKRILRWTPCADEEEFRRQAILVHARSAP
jgi:predicted dehydrogenase/nucleoside-diphosphate-sugar epimerase